MANEQNLKSWVKGQSGNPKGKPKGSIHLSTRIRDLMSDKNFEAYISVAKKRNIIYKGAPIDAIIRVSIIKAVNGDDKAREWLSKYGWGHELEQAGSNKLVIETRQNTSVAPIMAKDANDYLKPTGS